MRELLARVTAAMRRTAAESARSERLPIAEGHDGALTRDEILRRAWGRERAHGDRSIDVLVRRQRRKVDEVGGEYTDIQTSPGVGYRFLTTSRRMPEVPAR